MGINTVVTIKSSSISSFTEEVNWFMVHNEEMVFHDKTVYGITQESYYDDEHGLMQTTMYSAIFQMEGKRR